MRNTDQTVESMNEVSLGGHFLDQLRWSSHRNGFGERQKQHTSKAENKQLDERRNSMESEQQKMTKSEMR